VPPLFHPVKKSYLRSAVHVVKGTFLPLIGLSFDSLTTHFTAHMAPALTSLAHPVAEAGKIAAHLLLEQFAASDPLPAQNIMLSFDLRIRESCGSNPEPSGPFF
jgi:hypothetical protein